MLALDQSDMSKVRLRVTSQTGVRHAGHKVGDVFEFESEPPFHNLGPDKQICGAALSSAWPFVWAVRFGANFPSHMCGEYGVRAACPDPENPVAFEVWREGPSGQRVSDIWTRFRGRPNPSAATAG